ncbi:MAG: DUF692 domain-containing protein [Myxococcota bacterium]
MKRKRSLAIELQSGVKPGPPQSFALRANTLRGKKPPQSKPSLGLGFRLALAEELLAAKRTRVRFVEVAPENYLGVGGRRRRLLDEARERWPVVCHGLCGDLAGAQPLDWDFIQQLKTFLRQTGVAWYSDHLCYTSTPRAHTHDLIPLPFCHRTVRQTAVRIRHVREMLDIPMAVENVSATMRAVPHEMSEPEFISAVAREADCQLLLDVNNIYVNACNFGFDPKRFIDRLPLERVVQIHIAGHDRRRPNLLIDDHGSPIAPPVYDLLRYALRRLPQRPPVLLERDNNIPPLPQLEEELDRLNEICREVYAHDDTGRSDTQRQATVDHARSTPSAAICR